jgi:predicted permease
VLLISAAVSLGTGLLAALAPAVRLAWQANLGSGLRATSTPTTTRTGARLRASLVGAQLAAALVLGIGAMLLFGSLLKVTGSNVGFESRDLVAATMPMKLPGTEGIAMHDLWNRYVDELRAVPGVTSVVAASDAPFLDPSWAPWVSLPGDAANTRRPGVAGFVVTPGYFEGIGTVVEAGREFGPQDVANGDPVVVVNTAFVRAHLRDRDPIGATIQFRNEEDGTESRRVIGVVGDIVQQRIEDGPRAAVYTPHTQVPWPYGATAMLRTTRHDDGLFDEIRTAAARFNAFVPVTSIGWMSDRVNATFVEPTFRAALFAAFAAVSVFLAVIGLYGSLAHSVSRRTRELGVRMALGADHRSIFAMVIRQGAVVAVAGLTAGLAGAMLVTRALQSFLYDVSPFDPWTFVAAAAIVAGVSLAAALPPARRAARVDVATSLRD